MRGKFKCILKKSKLKILDIDGHLIDTIRPLDLEDTLDLLQLKYGRKKKNE